MRIAPLVPKKSHDWLTIAIIIAVVAFVVLIVTSKADAGQLVINSLPYTVNQSQHTAAVWDTVTLSANLSSATDGITLGTGTHHWYISMAGRILTFGTAAGNSAVGIRMNGNSNNIVVDGGSIVHAPAGRLASDDADPTYSASDPTNCIGILIGNYNIEVKNLSRCIVKGIATSGSVGAIFGGSYGINIHDNDSVINCYYGFQQRDLFMGCAVKTEAGISAIANGATYNVRLYRNNLISRAHTTVYFKGTSSLDPIRVEIDTNKVLIDCRNNMWTTSNGNDYHGCANGYGIQVTYAAAGSKIIGDTVRAGNKYLGGQGIQIVHSVATQASPLEIAYNYIDVHQGYELEFGTAFHPVAIKIRQQVFGLWLHHNTGTLWIDNTQAVNTHGIAYSATGHCLQLQTEFDLSERTFWGPFYITVENNNFSTKCVTDVNSSYYWADVVNFETCLFDDPTTVWRNNRLYSEVTAVYGIGQGGDGGSMYRRPYGDTISQKAMTFASKQVTFTLGNLVGTTDFNVFRDIVYGTGTSPTSHDWLHTGTATSTSRTMRNTVARTVPIKCINVGGIPLQNATVTVVNAYGTSFSLGTTGSSGTLSRVFNYAFYQNIGLDSLAFNPHTATVTWIDQNGQSTTVTQTFTVDQNTDTVRVYAPDLVEYRTVFNQGNNPSTYQVQLRGPKRQDIPLNKAREVVVFRGGTVTTTRNLTRYIDGVAADSIGVATAGDAYYEASFCVTDGDTIIWCVNNASVTGNGIRVRRIDASVKPMRLIDTRDILTGNLALYGAIAVPASLGGDDILIECRSSGNYSQAYQVEYLRSNDGGATWSTPASLSAWGGLSIRSAVEPWGLGTAWFTGIPASNSWLVRGATYNGTTWTRDDPNTTGMQIHREYAAAMTDDSTMVYLWADTAGVANIRYAYKKVGVGSWAYGSAYSTGMSGGWGSNPPQVALVRSRYSKILRGYWTEQPTAGDRVNKDLYCGQWNGSGFTGHLKVNQGTQVTTLIQSNQFPAIHLDRSGVSYSELNAGVWQWVYASILGSGGTSSIPVIPHVDTLITLSDASVSEGGDLTFTATISPILNYSVAFDATTSDGTAVAGRNYVPITTVSPIAQRHHSILSGTASTTITIHTIRDGLVTGPLDMYVTLSAFSDPILWNSLGRLTGTGTIQNIDANTPSSSGKKLRGVKR